MAARELEVVEKVSRVENKGKADAVDFEVERLPPDKEQFETLMAAQSKTVSLPEMTPERAGLIEQIREVGGKVDLLRRKTPAEILEQTKGVIAQVDDIKRKLKTPDLQLDTNVQVVMQNKLSHIDDKLRVALEKVGGEYTTLEVKEARASLRTPAQRFLHSLEMSEAQLQNIYNQVGALGTENKTINPAELLALQMKMGFVQQELEFFTSVLNKSLESTKTLMNVQV